MPLASGNGQTDKAHSVSVALATDDEFGVGSAVPNKVTEVTKSDSTDLAGLANKGLFVGTGGNLAVRMKGQVAAVTIPNVQDGSFIEGDFDRVMSTNTTASNILAFARV